MSRYLGPEFGVRSLGARLYPIQPFIWESVGVVIRRGKVHSYLLLSFAGATDGKPEEPIAKIPATDGKPEEPITKIPTTRRSGDTQAASIKAMRLGCQGMHPVITP